MPRIDGRGLRSLRLGVLYSLLLLAAGIFGIHESALFLGVAFAPFGFGPLFWPVMTWIVSRRDRNHSRGFLLLMGVHSLGLALWLMTAQSYEWNFHSYGLLLAKTLVYLLGQVGIWMAYLRALRFWRQ